jgi:hypothetical protein
MADLDATIRRLVDNFVEELTGLVRQAAVDAAVSALKGTGGSVKVGGRRAAKRSGPKTRAKGGRRSPEEIKKTLGKVLRYIKENKGTRSETIRKELGLSATQTGDALLRLLDPKGPTGKVIAKKGSRRSTTYSAV